MKTTELLAEALQPSVRWLVATDDWCPNHGADRSRVRAEIIRLRPHENSYRVLLSGADDFGLAMDDLSMERAQYVFERLPPLISKQAARDLGFAEW